MVLHSADSNPGTLTNGVSIVLSVAHGFGAPPLIAIIRPVAERYARSGVLPAPSVTGFAGGKPKVEEILTRAKLEHTLRTASEEEICYEVNLPLDRKTDRLTEAILKLDPENVTAVDWKEPKSKK